MTRRKSEYAISYPYRQLLIYQLTFHTGGADHRLSICHMESTEYFELKTHCGDPSGYNGGASHGVLRDYSFRLPSRFSPRVRASNN